MNFSYRSLLTTILLGLTATLPVTAQPDSKTYQLRSQYFTYQDRLQTYIIPCSLQLVFKIGKNDYDGDNDYCNSAATKFDRVIMYKPFKNRTGCTLVYPDNNREDIGRCIVIDRAGREIEWGK